MKFTRSSGLTPSEKILADLCDASFLTLWSYPNLYRKSGKELCDLMVVFDNDIIIFSDKSCTFPDTGNLTLDWVRWYRKSILESVRQLKKAENWLKTQPQRVYLDARCTQKLPVALPPIQNMKFHKVCVALGAADRAEQETGKRSLKVSTCKREEKFSIGRIVEAQEFIHVFDETNLSVILNELSTARDFLAYLTKKEELFQSEHFAFAESELDLLAYFLWNGREFPIPAKKFKLDPNLWEKVETDQQFLAGREENKISIFWDRLIEYFTKHFLNETLETGNEIPVEDYERGIRLMAAENRFHRRILTKCILERAERARKGYVPSILPSSNVDTHYVLLIGPGDGGEDHATYRKARAEQLYARCIASKAAVPKTQFIVGLGLDAKDVKGSSEDLIFLDTSDWSEKKLEGAEKLRQELGFFVTAAKHSPVIEDEYPVVKADKRP